MLLKRLPIIDLRPQDCQALACADRYWIDYNEDVQKCIELRTELEMLGHACRQRSCKFKLKLGFAAPTGFWFLECTEQMWHEIESPVRPGEFADMVNVRRKFDTNFRHRCAFFNLAAWARVDEVKA